MMQTTSRSRSSMGVFMPLSIRGSLVSFFWIAAVCIAGPAQTQTTPQRGETVLERHRPDYSPLGLGQGGLVLYPSLHVSEVYDDNILWSDTATRDDFITTIEPRLRVQSQWSAHELVLQSAAKIGRYVSNPNEDNEEYSAGASARLDFSKNTSFDVAVSYAAEQESRSSPDDAGGIKPTDFSLASAAVGFSNRWNRLSLRLGGRGQRYNYDDSTGAGGVTIDEDDRDRKEYGGGVTVGYEIMPQYEAFVRGSYNKIDYDDRVDSGGVNRDSEGFEAAAGTRIDITGVLFGNLFAGYRRQLYDDPALESNGAQTYGGAITWNANKLTTVKASIVRDIVETTQTGSSGYFQTVYSASIDHELRRNLIIGGDSSVTFSKYKGNGRDDDVFNAGVYIRYLMHRHLYLNAMYSHQRRDTNAAGADFEKNLFMLRLETQF